MNTQQLGWGREPSNLASLTDFLSFSNVSCQERAELIFQELKSHD